MKVIKSKAFSYVSWEKITVPESIVRIDEDAFEGPYGESMKKSVVIESSSKKITPEAFYVSGDDLDFIGKTSLEYSKNFKYAATKAVARNIKYYGNKNNLTKAIDRISFTIDQGEFTAIMGASGSGKTTLLKLLNGLLTPSEGEVLIAGNHPGIETKRIVSYLPDKMYLGSWMRVSDLLTYYSDFFEDFDMSRANAMLESLKISPKDRLKTMSKGTKEKVQLILTMSRRAKLYCLDEPIAGVDPAARDYILSTILNNYEPDASILISTHLISDVENILDEVIFIQEGQLKLHASVEDIRMQEGESIDSYFREVFKC